MQVCCCDFAFVGGIHFIEFRCYLYCGVGWGLDCRVGAMCDFGGVGGRELCGDWDFGLRGEGYACVVLWVLLAWLYVLA